MWDLRTTGAPLQSSASPSPASAARGPGEEEEAREGVRATCLRTLTCLPSHAVVVRGVVASPPSSSSVLASGSSGSLRWSALLACDDGAVLGLPAPQGTAAVSAPPIVGSRAAGAALCRRYCRGRVARGSSSRRRRGWPSRPGRHSCRRSPRAEVVEAAY